MLFSISYIVIIFSMSINIHPQKYSNVSTELLKY